MNVPFNPADHANEKRLSSWTMLKTHTNQQIADLFRVTCPHSVTFTDARPGDTFSQAWMRSASHRDWCNEHCQGFWTDSIMLRPDGFVKTDETYWFQNIEDAALFKLHLP